MNLLFVHQYFGAMGGAESTIQITASELRERGHKVGILYSQNTGKCEDVWQSSFGPNSFRLAGPGNIEHAEAALNGFKPNALFVHNLQDLVVFESLLNSGIPVVRMVHDHALYCMREYKYNYFTRAICHRPAGAHCVFPCLATFVRNKDGGFPLKLASYSRKLKELELNRKCDRFVVYSEYCKKELAENGFDANRIHKYVPIRPLDQNHSSSHSKNLVLFAGQIIRGKGVDLLVKALAKISVPFECVIMGDGNHREHCENLSRKLGISEKVKFVGFLPPAEMRRYYEEATVLAVSSVWPEPFGLVGPEAMRFGLPVVAFDAGGIGEWLRHGINGALVPWMDVDAFASAIEGFLRNRDAARTMGARGKELVAREYDLNAQVERLEKVFWALITGATSQINENAGVNAVHGNR